MLGLQSSPGLHCEHPGTAPTGEVAQVRAGRALSSSKALLFLPCPDATNALGLGGWVEHTGCLQELLPHAAKYPGEMHLQTTCCCPTCCLPQALLPDSTAASVLHKCVWICLPLSVYVGTPRIGCPCMREGGSPRSAALAHCPRLSQRNGTAVPPGWQLLVIHDSSIAFSLLRGTREWAPYTALLSAAAGTLVFSWAACCP